MKQKIQEVTRDFLKVLFEKELIEESEKEALKIQEDKIKKEAKKLLYSISEIREYGLIRSDQKIFLDDLSFFLNSIFDIK